MILERPIGHEVWVERLWGAARAGRLPHAFTFEGPAGSGKFVAMRWFAAGLLCEGGPGEPCLACGPCKRVLSGGHTGNHGDLLILDPVEEGEETIRIARVAERSTAGEAPTSIEGFLALRTVEGGRRPILVREAHRMNAAAQNALLKTLEEPRPGTLLCLETHRPDRLLATIQSRCVRVRCPVLSDADVRSVLEASGVDAQRARALVRLAPGSPGAALGAQRRGAHELFELALGVLRGELAPLRAAARAWEIEGEFVGATPGAKARARARFIASRLAALAGDLLRGLHGITPRIPAHELAPTLGRGREAGLRRAVGELVECRGDVGRNLAPEAIVERAFLALGDALGSTGGRRPDERRTASGARAEGRAR